MYLQCSYGPSQYSVLHVMPPITVMATWLPKLKSKVDLIQTFTQCSPGMNA